MLILVAADALPADEHLGPRVADAPVADLREGAADAVARRRDVAQVALDRVLGHVALEAVDALAVPDELAPRGARTAETVRHCANVGARIKRQLK